MKKINIENYEKPKYSSLKMVTGKILPAGLAVAAIISTTSSFTASAGNFPMITPQIENEIIAGDIPAPIIKETKNEEVLISVMVDGNKIDFDVKPIIENGAALVPMRYIFEALNAVVTWDNDTKTATAVRQNDTIVIEAGNSKMTVNGEKIDLDIPAKLVDSRILVPVRAVSEAFNAIVDWDGDTYEISITTHKAISDENMFVTAGVMPMTEISE